MKQSAMKTFAIIILIGINLFLAISLSDQKEQITYYDEQLINSTVENMKANGMIIDDSLIPRMRKSYSVLEGIYDTDVLLGAAGRFMPSGQLSVYALPAGGVHVMNGDGDSVSFYRNLNFSFRSAGSGEILAGIEGAAPEQIKNEGQFDGVCGGFLSSYGARAENDPLSLVTDSVLYYRDGDVYEIKCFQCAEGLPVYGFTVRIWVVGGKVRAADGKWCFGAPGARIDADTQDVISILINESGRLRTEYRSMLKEDPSALMPAYMVSDLSANYYIFIDDSNHIYFVPVYVISYRDRNGSIYNTVNGKMISVTAEDAETN